jgi:glyoxylase-like metal-dependent hydrolase (beta-lactamase superfamily II)
MHELYELTPHISLLPILNATRTNIYVVHEEGGGFTLIDPGPVGTAPAILALDRRGDIRLRRVVLTHAHPAHAGALARVVRGTGAPAFVAAADAPYLDGREPPLLPRGRRGQLIAALGRVIDLCPPVYKLNLLEPGQPLGALVPIAVPGHTPGHLCLWHAQDQALLSGDALLYDGERLSLSPEAMSEDPATARTAVAALRGLGAEHLLPGHGPPMLASAQARIDRFLDELET